MEALPARQDAPGPTGVGDVLSGAPFGYQYVRDRTWPGPSTRSTRPRPPWSRSGRSTYADDGASIADLAGWLTGQGVPTHRQAPLGPVRGRAMLRNPAYAGTAVFGKTMVPQQPAGLNRVARLQGRSVPRPARTVDRPREEWTEIPVPGDRGPGHLRRVQQRLASNKRYAARNTKIPSLLQGLAACTACGYGYYRTSTRTT